PARPRPPGDIRGAAHPGAQMAHAAAMKRFWTDVAVAPHEGGFRITLDGRPIRTQGGAPQVLPSAAVAEALAEEWRNQAEEVDPHAFVLRDLADLAIDEIAPNPEATIARLLAYGETDT